MSLTSFSFFVFLIATVVLYYTVPKMQKYILLVASFVFFLKASPVSVGWMLLLMVYILFVTYGGAIAIEKTEGVKRDVVSTLTILGLAATLFVLKYAFNMGELISSLLAMNVNLSWLDFVPIMGLSYFTLSAIGYVLDVRWQMYLAERNIATVALFIYYFPQVVSGPVTRFSAMRKQILERTALEYDNIEYGLRRMLWGYFKKLVISERFAMIVQAVYANPQNYGGADICIATLCYAVQLYTDFSGCMDIVLGTSALFGIRLPENFCAPFFSKTVQEFWQRWHITLGLWFKDYVMYPVQISAPLVKMGKFCKQHYGKKVGKKVPFYASMLVLWFLIGVWHGCTAHYFVASAIVPCTLLMISDLGSSYFTKMGKKLPWQENSLLWDNVNRLKTLLLICICWVFVCAESVPAGMVALYDILTNIGDCHMTELWKAAHIGSNFSVMILGMAVLIFADYLEDKGTSLYEILNKRSWWVRTVILYVEIILIIDKGLVGKSEFIYFQF
ncbi:MBOAT family O-acyltransferase [Selenomonas ruminantium]|uniref:D-alanyl-lipoteichoic acid acyltransferase DltB, MBOAT superfamily n=1 Tax=Selenomonas ruminantium TaxID=971 RepID=A0A1K1QNN8_SELRU|nr:MBOAT family O-acyltransferase [Selenomonas ruminantium]SFW61316.1 D-alanyl-lipoteichoic acid acyltransferase DltB, MBOAT superfamily [Selenomonas ruminantium]